MTQPYVKTLKANGIATITFFHPAHNSMPSTVLADLESAIHNSGEDDDVKVIILQSGGERTFCAGASFDELKSIEDNVEGKEFFMGFARVILAMRSCPKIIIGRIQGKAVGGGVGLAAATDYCYATKYASIKLSELTIGIGPFVIAPAVERKIGLNGLSNLTLNATEFYSPEWAKEKGLYAALFETSILMDEAVQALAVKLASYNPEAVTAMKKALWEGTDHWPSLLEERAEMSGTLVLSKFTKDTLGAL
ncbi:enoyl-CoA hydratase/isomerase family protein [Dokdonia sp. 4H-3-7-5]|uniref:enoyl-CoA hydratase/isomerase family protein n=1 Tax=Dokdonia sp. (strain 4H-3-7-5) TaxID=983548 RepID=UPI00020A6BCA|nr:enoyl-CoA hydratase/isomerase family protein [Dokdonia sp. 4H-3-7-5]AEE19596.1 Enoyl-CoA hydratase/isomerase [Dokdonia sp. 4H-3-7-5]